MKEVHGPSSGRRDKGQADEPFSSPVTCQTDQAARQCSQARRAGQAVCSASPDAGACVCACVRVCVCVRAM